MSKKPRGEKVLTPVGRLSFPHLFEPSSFEGQAPKYSCHIVFEAGTDLSAITDAIKKLAIATWPDKSSRPKLRNPIHDSTEDGKTKYEGYEEGTKYLNLKSVRRPGVVDGKCQDITNPEDLYPGCKVRATLNPFSYEGFGGGISLGLQHVQKVGDAKPFGNFSRAQDDFDEVEDLSDDDIAPGDEDDMFA